MKVPEVVHVTNMPDVLAAALTSVLVSDRAAASEQKIAALPDFSSFLASRRLEARATCTPSRRTFNRCASKSVASPSAARESMKFCIAATYLQEYATGFKVKMNSLTTVWAVVFALLLVGTFAAVSGQYVAPTPPPEPLQQPVPQPPLPVSYPTTPEAQAQILRRYFSTVWPNMPTGSMDSAALAAAYASLDCWYEDFMPSLVGKLEPALYAKDAMKPLDPATGQYALLDGGTVCDCDGVNAPLCRNESDRTKCQPWPYFKAFLNTNTLLRRAFDSTNTSKNYTTDSIQRQNVSGRKGFPNFSYFEGMIFPGKTGIPEMCTLSPDPYWSGRQPGVDGACLRNAEPPWYSLPDCRPGDRCVEFRSGGNIFNKAVKARSACGFGGTGDDVRFATDCQPDGFPKSVCESVAVADFAIMKTYPLLGCGMWWTVGRSVAANTKLGFLMDATVGCGMDVQTLLDLCGPVVQAPYNLVQQVRRVSDILLKGSVTATDDYPSMTVLDLRMHGYTYQTAPTTADAAYDAAKKLVRYWYLEGYTGLETGLANGFNYNHKKYFPIGCHYSYGKRFDNIILAFMAYKKLDTVQLVLEPQDTLKGARPAYAFEILCKIPTTEYGRKNSAFGNDSSSTQCHNCYMLDPSAVPGGLTAYLTSGYISVNSLPASLETVNPKKYKARADSRSFKINDN